jgi:sigma-B regulation protein RsbU (phosphoserine phosphatase)
LTDAVKSGHSSDGITESQDPSGAEFGEDRLVALLRDLREEPIERILERVFQVVKAFAGPAPQFDDITLVLVRRGAGDV